MKMVFIYINKDQQCCQELCNDGNCQTKCWFNIWNVS